MGEVAAPLLAGFSIALIGVIAQNPGSFRWAGLSLLLLTLAVGMLLLSVQSGFHARQMYWTRDELLPWFAGSLNETSEKAFSGMHTTHLQLWKKWVDRTRRSYNSGIILLMLGVAATLAPPTAQASDLISAADPLFRWSAVVVAALLAVAEFIWWWATGKEGK
ncbi:MULTISPECIES: hypothetical protein [Arthrobacter]|uniref:Uncharacterized protein n=1 Tax=Arthrobacter nanjingensis TaxID=1387716 RepID=A0ABU9KNP1_9MICC|nr:hypothetical protein [Arthrobacter sp. YJM1]